MAFESTFSVNRFERVTVRLVAILIAGFVAGFYNPAVSVATGNETTPISFNDQVRPILSDRCFYCHGPDDKHREAGLRLDDRDEAVQYEAIVPQNADASLMIQRVLEEHEDLVMPPPSSKKGRLTIEEIAILRQWIAEGAVYEPHWAFAPLSELPPPAIEASDWPTNPIDHFVLAKLQKANLSPSPEADRATLIRRVSLDLTGLLPDPAAVAQFEADTRGGAYERLVDSLLASPHFAERWGRHWLDQARYADSNGYSVDSQRTMWPYRDWVIRAIGDDMPFDQFTIEQVAGDLLPGATKLHQVASAFHRNTLINQEGGTDAEQFRHESVVDRVNTTGAVWLSLTLGCAQCHTHKFDPIQHREYYEMFAFFNSGTDVNSTGSTVAVRPGEVLGIGTSPLDQQLAKRRAELENNFLEELLLRQFPAESDHSTLRWQTVQWSKSGQEVVGQADDVSYEIDGDASLKVLDDSSLLVSGSPDPNSTYRLTFTADKISVVSAPGGLRSDGSEQADVADPEPLTRIGGMRLRVLMHDSLPKSGPGLAGNGNFVLTGISVTVDGKPLRPSFAIADHEQPSFPISGAVDDDPKTGWAINVAAGSKAVMNADHEAVLAFEPAVELRGDSVVRVELQHALNTTYLVGRFAIDFSSSVPPLPTADDDAKLIAAIKRSESKRTATEKKLVDQSLRTRFPSESNALAEPEVAVLMVMADLPQPRQTFISLRGDFLRPDQEVGQLHPGAPAALLPALPAAAGRSRLDLAKWLVDPQNPLTPRVTVNRIWMRYFGIGLVETEEDFGTQGTPPTHPDLLDWLARRFQDQGLSSKSLHRQIVTSRTYRQSSKHRGDLADIDPLNRLLARQNRVRVEAEIVRDAALSASGELDRRIGGPSVHPPQPDGVYSFTQNAKSWVADKGGDRFRRAMYTEFFRSAPHPLFTTFDAPDFQTVCTRRNRSNTPLQALTVANDEAFVELARALAMRVTKEMPESETPQQLDRVFRLSLSRAPTPGELAILANLHQRLIDSFQGDAAAEVQAWLGDAGKQMSADQSQYAAALVAVCRTLFNTDNFITRE